MTAAFYDVLMDILLVGITVILLCALAFLGLAIVGWRGPFRRRRLGWSAICVMLVPLLLRANKQSCIGCFFRRWDVRREHRI